VSPQSIVTDCPVLNRSGRDNGGFSISDGEIVSVNTMEAFGVTVIELLCKLEPIRFTATTVIGYGVPFTRAAPEEVNIIVLEFSSVPSDAYDEPFVLYL
jgi:hypothetical protein